MKPKRALLIIGHGSKQKGFQAAMEKVAKKLRQEKEFNWVDCAYLEVTPPLIPQAIDLCAQKGAKEISVLPYFLLTGLHVTVDIPEIVASARKKYRGRVKIKLCPYLGYDEKIVEVVRQRIHEGR